VSLAAHRQFGGQHGAPGIFVPLAARVTAVGFPTGSAAFLLSFDFFFAGHFSLQLLRVVVDDREEEERRRRSRRRRGGARRRLFRR
jgi:hypothetical protein